MVGGCGVCLPQRRVVCVVYQQANIRNCFAAFCNGKKHESFH
jgi:hypothetical protein